MDQKNPTKAPRSVSRQGRRNSGNNSLLKESDSNLEDSRSNSPNIKKQPSTKPANNQAINLSFQSNTNTTYIINKNNSNLNKTHGSVNPNSSYTVTINETVGNTGNQNGSSGTQSQQKKRFNPLATLLGSLDKQKLNYGKQNKADVDNKLASVYKGKIMV
jgi:hypothetical protein